jgi:sugar transferase (PEP-CTERM/EpsH1 system associated)
MVWQISRVLRRERPDIVHTHAWGTLLEGLVAARLARVPVIIHGEHGTLQLKRHQRWLQRIGLSAADQVLAVSSRLAERITRDIGFPQQRIQTIRNGVDLARFVGIDREAARRALDLPMDVAVIATVGRLVPVKDQATLITALSIVRRRLPSALLLIAGDGPLRDALLAHARTLGIENNVRMIGHRPDVETVFSAADVFALSSVSEGLSNTILEAMASGLPVVATRVGGADEMVVEGETGLLVPASSPGELAGALATVLADAGRRSAMGAAGRARVHAEFTLDGMVRRYERLYCDMAMAGQTTRAERRLRARNAASARVN